MGKKELWLRPKKKVLLNDKFWYDNAVVGPHPLENYMKELSKSADLSRYYTNHCIRSTVISSLDEEGFEARHITAVSGHKSENTIHSYSTKCPVSKKREMSDALSSKLDLIVKQDQPPPKKMKLQSTVSRAPEKENIPKEQFGTINQLDLVDWIEIDNNADDFELGKILDEFERNEKALVPSEGLAVKTPQTPKLQEPQQASGPNTLIQNFTSNQDMLQFPFLPKMYFPNSNITINYNFHK